MCKKLKRFAPRGFGKGWTMRFGLQEDNVNSDKDTARKRRGSGREIWKWNTQFERLSKNV